MYHSTIEEIQRMDSFLEEMNYYFKSSFSSYDRSLVRNVVYIDSWSGYEESSGLAIFQDWNNLYYSIHFGHSVMSELSDYHPEQIPEELAIEKMIEMDELLLVVS